MRAVTDAAAAADDDDDDDDNAGRHSTITRVTYCQLNEITSEDIAVTGHMQLRIFTEYKSIKKKCMLTLINLSDIGKCNVINSSQLVSTC